MKLVTLLMILTALAPMAGCAPPPEEAPMTEPSRLIELLAGGRVVFGMFSGERTEQQGFDMGANRDLDFVFYSLENGPFDIPTMRTYMSGLDDGSGPAQAPPVALRIPPIRGATEEARDHTGQGIGADVGAIVFPHVENAGEAALAVSMMGDDLWPANPTGSLINMLIIEDRVGIENAREIVSTAGVSVAIPGPGDLRRSYSGDMEAVENAIQTVLALCLEFDVPCGITAGPDDIAARIEQGFRVFILSNPDALAIGRAAAGRS